MQERSKLCDIESKLNELSKTASHSEVKAEVHSYVNFKDQSHLLVNADKITNNQNGYRHLARHGRFINEYNEIADKYGNRYNSR